MEKDNEVIDSKEFAVLGLVSILQERHEILMQIQQVVREIVDEEHAVEYSVYFYKLFTCVCQIFLFYIFMHTYMCIQKLKLTNTERIWSRCVCKVAFCEEIAPNLFARQKIDFGVNVYTCTKTPVLLYAGVFFENSVILPLPFPTSPTICFPAWNYCHFSSDYTKIIEICRLQ